LRKIICLIVIKRRSLKSGTVPRLRIDALDINISDMI